MAIPYGEDIIGNNIWFRTEHSDPKNFAFKFNKNGTISPERNPKLVFGISKPVNHRWIGLFADPLNWEKTFK